jgi:hypothetical protein
MLRHRLADSGSFGGRAAFFLTAKGAKDAKGAKEGREEKDD